MKRRKSPLVSVVMPVYNSAKFLPQALESIQNQSYRNLEIICVDDASTDNSWSILKKYKRRYLRLRIYHTSKHVSVGAISNLAIRKGRGKYICRMDSDDVMLKERVARQVAFLENNPAVVAVGGQCRLMDEKGKTIDSTYLPNTHEEIVKQLMYKTAIIQPTLMVNRKKLPPGFYWYSRSKKLGEDIDLYFRLAMHGKLANLEEKILLYRRHPQTLAATHQKDEFVSQLKSRFTAFTRYGEKITYQSILRLALTFCQTFILPYPVKLWRRLWQKLQLA